MYNSNAVCFSQLLKNTFLSKRIIIFTLYKIHCCLSNYFLALKCYGVPLHLALVHKRLVKMVSINQTSLKKINFVSILILINIGEYKRDRKNFIDVIKFDR